MMLVVSKACLASAAAVLLCLSPLVQGFVAVQHSRTSSRKPAAPLRLSMGTPVPGKSMLKGSMVGIGSCAPQTKLTNGDLESLVETSDEWISTRTGIKSRHLLQMGEGLSDLASEAARKALEMSGLKAEDIDIVIMATSSPDDMFGDATTVAASIGCKRGVVAFDLTAACSGFLFASVTAGQFLTTGAYQRALVIGADALTRWVDWDDRNTCILFGDGAGAAVFDSSAGVGSGGGLLGWAMHSDGGGHNCLTLEYQGEEKLLTQGKGVTSGRKFAPLQMNGREVYKFATREVPTVIQEALENAGMSVEDVDHLLLHQANIRIMETVAQRLGMPMEKVITNLHEYGNTSAASIPLALDEAVRSGQVKKGDVIACAGFGAGLSWGSAIIRWG